MLYYNKQWKEGVGISENNVEKLFYDMLGEINKERIAKGNEGRIDLKTLETITQTEFPGEEYVINLNDSLTDTFKHIVISFGFEDFYSLYLYACSNEQEEVFKYDSGKKKDFTKLNKVRRTVVRNGRRTAITFYENPKGTDNKQKMRSNRDSKPNSIPVSEARELNIMAQGDEETPIPTKELHAVNNLLEGFVVVGEFLDLTRIKVYLDGEGNPRAVQGLQVDGEYLRMPFRATDGNLTGFYQRAFFETIKVAMNWELGVRLEKEDTNIQDELARSSGFNETDNNFEITYEELKEKFGELP